VKSPPFFSIPSCPLLSFFFSLHPTPVPVFITSSAQHLNHRISPCSPHPSYHQNSLNWKCVIFPSCTTYFPPSYLYFLAALIGATPLAPSHRSRKSLYATTLAFMKSLSKSELDGACGLWCKATFGDRPAADLFLAGGEVVLEAEFGEA